MKCIYGLFAAAALINLSSCSIFKKTPKDDFTDGFYNLRNQQYRQKVYVCTNEDSILVYTIQKKEKQLTLNPADYIAYPKKNAHHIIPDLIFSKNTFDIDFLTMPLKLRPSLQQVPPQLNTNLNGAVYFGFRKDAYHLNSKITPLQQRQQQLNHFGFSVGGFTGIGNTFISPTTTNLQLQQEYDGVVWSKGFAAIIAINNFTVGIACGADHLLDKNRQVWIYQSKPWFGLAFGLNLN